MGADYSTYQTRAALIAVTTTWRAYIPINVRSGGTSEANSVTKLESVMACCTFIATAASRTGRPTRLHDTDLHGLTVCIRWPTDRVVVVSFPGLLNTILVSKENSVVFRSINTLDSPRVNAKGPHFIEVILFGIVAVGRG